MRRAKPVSLAPVLVLAALWLFGAACSSEEPEARPVAAAQSTTAPAPESVSPAPASSPPTAMPALTAVPPSVIPAPASSQATAIPAPSPTIDVPPTAIPAPSATDRVPPSATAPVPTATSEPEDEGLKIVTLLPKDAIPAILDPKFLSVEEADEKLMDRMGSPDDALVLGLSINGDSRAYYIPTLSSVEIVNDTVGGQPLAVTW